MPTETHDHQCHVCAAYRALSVSRDDVQAYYCHQCKQQTRWLRVGSVPHARWVEQRAATAAEYINTEMLVAGAAMIDHLVEENATPVDDSFRGNTAGELIAWLQQLPAGTPLLGNNIVGEMCGTPSFHYQVYDDAEVDVDGNPRQPCVMVWLD